MRIAIMQPYFLPYIGYFQLIDAVDKFVLYDNIEYTKKGWINRNYYLCNGEKKLFTVPIQRAHDTLNIDQRFLLEDCELSQNKILNKLYAAYKKAPHFESGFSLLEKIILHENRNLFAYIYFSISEIVSYLDIKTPIIISSSLEYDSCLKGEKKVLAICEDCNASVYLNSIGGQKLYNKKIFEREGILLRFLQSQKNYYKQFSYEFVDSLSIVDVIMFNKVETIKQFLKNYKLL